MADRTAPAGQSTPVDEPDGLTALYTTTFEDQAGQLFAVGDMDSGAHAMISDGRYVVDVDDGEWQVITPGPMPHPRNGVIEADVTLSGAGYAGLVARSTVDADGNDSMYVCLMDDTGWAGCVASHGGEYRDLFFGPIEGYQAGASQRLRLTVVEDRIEFVVNNRLIGATQDSTVQIGAWGVHAESQSEATTTVSFDNLTIYTVDGQSIPTASSANLHSPASDVRFA
ncbi:MAG TPA: hypothetical protein VFV93_07600 [Thermomicrobiales bacterium]|nr:hypothetical protein [Thermomicrobiales bacterium]